LLPSVKTSEPFNAFRRQRIVHALEGTPATKGYFGCSKVKPLADLSLDVLKLIELHEKTDDNRGIV